MEPARMEWNDVLSIETLYDRAADHKSVELADNDLHRSKLIKKYALDAKLLAALSKARIRQVERSDGIFTLSDENPQHIVPGWNPSHYWNFRIDEETQEYDLRIQLSVHLEISDYDRGVVFRPWAFGGCASPADRLPNFRLFKLLTEHDPEAPEVCKEIAASDGYIVVSWSDLGLGGIRQISELFDEFARGNKAVLELGRTGVIFVPAPWVRNQKPAEMPYVIEPAQPKLFKIWDGQLQAYRTRLNIVR